MNTLLNCIIIIMYIIVCIEFIRHEYVHAVYVIIIIVHVVHVVMIG